MIHLLLDAPPESAEVVLEGDHAHHFGRVRRVRPGETVTASDGRGGIYAGSIVEAMGRRIRLALEPKDSVPPPVPTFRVVVPVLPADRMAWAVEKLVEVGAMAIAPAVTSRARAPHDPARTSTRLRAVVRAAAEQSRRAWLPEVEEVRPLPEAVAGAGLIVAADRSGTPVARGLPEDPGSLLTLVTGPEGGFDSADRATLRAAGAICVSLGPSVLRSETAPVVLLALCSYEYGVLDVAPVSWLK